MEKRDLSYISLFSGAGLGCYGLTEAGFRCVATAELLPRRLAVQRVNKVALEDEAYVLGDLTEPGVQQQVLRQAQEWTDATGQEITVVLATPPCQGMSVANHKKQDETARNSLVVESLEMIKRIRPRFFILENVRGFATADCLDSDGKLKKIREAIQSHLGGKYNYLSRIVNLKDYGSPSSRTRTLVIGVRRDLHDIAPTDLFPDFRPAPTLAELIGDLPRLSEMGEISEDDIYHAFRPYDQRMRPWIENLLPGQSAFENQDQLRRPHRVINGEIVPNKAANGDKYRRNLWDKVAPCVHTRNDILASQSTVHPIDDRVFSIRELSRMMGLPDTFRWASHSLRELNALPEEQKQEFLKSNDVNIRQCLGEGVPTPVIQSIGSKISLYSSGLRLKTGRPAKNVERVFPPFAKFFRDVAPSKNRQMGHAAYYTRQDTVFSLLQRLPDFPKRKTLRVLEPAVGAGSFLPLLLQRYPENPIELDIVDISGDAIRDCGNLVDSLGENKRLTVRAHTKDFLSQFDETGFDLVVGNPPFGGKVKTAGEFQSEFGIRDIYGKFLEKSLRIATHVALVVPKSFLASPEMMQFRSAVAKHRHITAIEDYGEDAFLEIAIETIGIVIGPASSVKEDRVTEVVSVPLGIHRLVKQDYIADEQFPSWILYRNNFFDAIASSIRLGMFTPYRDRRLTKNMLSSSGEVEVLRARNICRSGSLINGLDRTFCPETLIPKSFWAKVRNKTCIIVPNLSYYPRAAVLPRGHYVDGSAAVLVPKSDEVIDNQLEFFASADFFFFYRIARNFSTRSLNIDSVSSYFWGLPKDGYEAFLPLSDFEPDSSLLFKIPNI